MSITLKEKTTSEITTPVVSKVTLFVDSSDEKLKKKLSDGSIVSLEPDVSGVGSVFGRTGAVTSETGDYTASEVDFVPSGNIIATDLQSAIEELDTEKLPLSHQGSGGSSHSLVNGSQSGFISPSDKSKLDGIESGATVNSSDAFLLNRANHIGTQLADTIADFSSATDARITAQKGVANGVSSLDASAKILQAQHGQYNDPLHHSVATTLSSGFMSNSDKSKLDGIEAGATSNQTDSYLLNRAHHTGTQSAITISDFVSSVESVIDSEKGIPFGIAPLDSSGVLPESNHGNYTGETLHSVATATNNGFMSSTDKNKLDGIEENANAGITELTGEISASGIGSAVATISNSAVMQKLLTGLSLPEFGQINSTDSLIMALAKLMSQSSLHPVELNTSMIIPSNHIYRRPQLTKLTGTTTKLSIKGTGRLIIRA